MTDRSKNHLRTCAVRLRPEDMGSVIRYDAGRSFVEAWKKVADDRILALKRGDARKWMPKQSLWTPIVAESASQVCIGREFKSSIPELRGKPVPFLYAERRIDPSVLQSVLAAWEMEITRSRSMRLAEAAPELTETEIPLSDGITPRQGRTPSASGWVYNVGRWRVSRRLSEQPIVNEAGDRISTRQDTEANLIAWDFEGLNRDGNDEKSYYRIGVEQMTVPGVEEMVFQVRPSVSRIVTWDTNRKVTKGWVKWGEDLPLLRLKVEAEPVQTEGEKSWRKVWRDRTREVMERYGQRLPDIDIEKTNILRLTPSHNRGGTATGRGATQRFYDACAHWLRRSLPEGEPLVMKGHTGFYVPTLSREAKDARDNPERGDWTKALESSNAQRGLAVFYHHTETAQRIKRCLAGAFEVDLEELMRQPDGTAFSVAGLTVLFLSPEQSEALVESSDPIITRNVAERCIQKLEELGGRWSALLETVSPKALEGMGEKKDPKPKLRRRLAQAGIPSQFLAHKDEPADDEDYAGKQGVRQTLNNGGLYSLPFEAKGVAGRPGLIGLYTIYRGLGERGMRGEAILTGLVPGSREALAYDLGQAGRRKWGPLSDLRCRVHSRDRTPLSQPTLQKRVKTALQQWREFHSTDMIIFVNQTGYIWEPKVSDKRCDQHPQPILQELDAALVRCRVQGDGNQGTVVQAAGDGRWDEMNGPAPPKPPTSKDTGFFLQNRQGNPIENGAYYYISSSKSYGRPGAHREKTRPSMTNADLRKNYHSLTSRELYCVEEGQHEARKLGKLAAYLCRSGPTWAGTTRYPSPLHLGKRILKDHPDDWN